MIRAGEMFTWRGAELPYLAHEYNRTELNERAIEVPIARHWIGSIGGLPSEGLEVGNVLSHYGPVGHRVVDLYEEAPGVDNLDLFDVEDRYSWIVAISTLEHVGCENGPHPFASSAAIRHLLSRLRPGGRMLATIPLGQQPYLDIDILERRPLAAEQETLTWNAETSAWDEHPGQVVWAPARENGWPSAVWVATWEAP